jgi:predicted dehydrogenase
MRIGIIGYGRIAPHHLKAFAALEDVDVVVASRSSENRERATEDGASDTWEDWREMLEGDAVDGAVLTVPVLAIPEVLEELIEAGKPVLTEKPVGLHPSVTSALAGQAESHDTPVMVGMNRRFYSNIRAVRELAQAENLLGITVNAPDRMHRIVAADIHPPEVLDAWLYANIVHSLDLIRFWAGEALSVEAHRREVRQFAPSYAANVMCENGVLAQYTGHFSSPGKWLIDVYFEESRVSFTGHETSERTFLDGTTEEIALDAPDQEFKPGFFRQAEYFVDGIRSGGGYEGYDLADAARTMELCRQLHEAPLVSAQ